MKIDCPSCPGCEECVAIGYKHGMRAGGVRARVAKAIRNAGLFGGTRSDRLRDRIFTGHVSIGPVTIFGANAMHYAAHVSTRHGYLCARPTTRQCGLQRWYLYLSPDGTPSSRTWGIGPGLDYR